MSEQRRWAARVLGGLVSVIALLALAFVATVVLHRRVSSLPPELLRVLDLNNETSSGTWFSVPRCSSC